MLHKASVNKSIEITGINNFWIQVCKSPWTITITWKMIQYLLSRRIRIAKHNHSLRDYYDIQSFLEIVCVRPKAWETWFFITVFEKSHEVVIRLNDYNNCPLWAKILSKLELHRFEVSHIHIVCKRFQYSRRLRVFIPNHLMRSNIIE